MLKSVNLYIPHRPSKCSNYSIIGHDSYASVLTNSLYKRMIEYSVV